MNTHDQTPTKPTKPTKPSKPSKAATAAANALLAILEPEFGAWSFKDEAVANVIDKALTEERAELAAAQKLLKEQRALYVRVDGEYDRKDKLLDEVLFDNKEQARLLGAGASREAALIAQLSQAKSELANTKAALAKRTDQANDYGIRLRAELTTAQKGHARYEYVRRLNPRQYAELWTKPRFDQAIDAAMKAAGGKANT